MSRQARRRAANASPRRWQIPLAVTAVLLIGFLVAIRLWLQAQPVEPDTYGLHSDIAGGHGGAEVTFNATVVATPVSVGDHEHIEVRDTLGDQIELDYNTKLGRWIAVRIGDQVEVHGQLYIDPGQVGVHCLHSQTSIGCPDPGWVRLASTTYS